MPSCAAAIYRAPRTRWPPVRRRPHRRRRSPCPRTGTPAPIPKRLIRDVDRPAGVPEITEVPNPARSGALEATHRSARTQRHKLFPGPGHAWTIISLRFEHPARPGPPEARKSMAEVQPNKGHDRGGGLRGPPVVIRAAAAGRCLVPAAPRGSEQNGRYLGRAIQ
jgi:hypothetical protein